MHLSSAIPWGGDPGQIQRWMGTYTGIWTINLPWRRGKWGRFVFQKPCTAGKTGDFANETGQFQVVLNEETWRPLCRRTWSTFLLVFAMATSADGAGIVNLHCYEHVSTIKTWHFVKGIKYCFLVRFQAAQGDSPQGGELWFLCVPT